MHHCYLQHVKCMHCFFPVVRVTNPVPALLVHFCLCVRSIALLPVFGDVDTVKEQGELHGVPLMMLANKQDLPEAISPADISVQFDMHKITNVAFRLQPCSGLTW